MSISCSCPQCAAKFRLDDRYAGKNIRCPKCTASMTVPAAGEAPSVAPRPPAVGPIVPKTAQVRPVAGAAPSVTPGKSVTPRPPAAKPLAAPIPPMPVAEEEAPGPMVFVKTPAAAAKPVDAAHAPAAKKPNPTLLLAGGGGVALIAILGAVLVFANPFGGAATNKNTAKKNTAKKSAAEKAAGKEGRLVLDWAEADRGNAKLTIDGRTHSFSPSGPIELPLKPGSHRVAIMRRSFEPINVEVTVPEGGSADFKPEWKAVDPIQIASNTPPTATPNVKPIDGSGFRVGSAVVPQGFEGWEQSLMVAKSRALQDKKDILLLFGSSDGSPATALLADGLKALGLPNGELGKRFVPVVIDFPTTADGYNRVNDRRQNIELAQDFRIQDLDDGPTMVLADSQARPYAIERDLEDAQAAELIAKLSAKRAERDKLLDAVATGAPAAKLAAAASAAEWIQSQNFSTFYKDDIQAWLAAAKQLDPDNAQGGLEALTEIDLISRLRRIDPRNRVEWVRQLSEADAWLKRKFVNQDRGARLHLLVGSVLSQYVSEKQGRVHFQRAVVYLPKDPELAERIKGLKQALAHENVLSTGTGFVIASGGYLLTNRHVIEGQGKLAVRVPGIKDPIPAAVIAEHADRDIALVKAEFPAEFNPAPVPVLADELNRGLEVAAFGYPQGDILGQSLKFTKGAISDLPNDANENMVLLDLRINPGNSGGPLCDNQGNVVGMITAKTNAEGLDTYGLAIPAEELEAFLVEALPKDAKRAAAAGTTAKTWDKVDKQISPAVLMLIKTR